MLRSFGVFNTDRPTRDRTIFPASALMSADQRHHAACQKYGLAIGLPAHIQHDMHRLTGWSRPLGLYLDSQMVRSLGLIEEPETDEEKAALTARAETHWLHHHSKGADPFKDDLIARSAPADLAGARFLRIESAVAERPGLAAELYPDLFTPSTDLVDKDGLADYRQLLKRMDQVQPGVFHDRDRNLLLFAHRFFRRSLSHRNKLNSYFLQSFDATAQDKSGLRVRLKLDPDLVGHPDSAKLLIELEYWHGPLYDDDVAGIPNGVAEHNADAATRHYEGVDRTQVWWKAPESRPVDGDEVIDYRTFEVEELIENPSGGLQGDQFGCRYAHAEFSSDEAAITHFDGAIRAYEGTRYLERFEKSIDRAGKHATYTKLFRFDGALGIPHWKRLLSDFFRGNALIPEYFGAPNELQDKSADEPTPDKEQSTSGEAPVLAALISIVPGHIEGDIRICAEHSQQLDDLIVPYVEIGTGHVARHIQDRLNLSDTMAVGIADDILNLSRIGFGTSENKKEIFRTEVRALASALSEDAKTGIVRKIAVPLCWEDNGLIVTLTIGGDAIKVSAVLDELPEVVDPTRSAAEWIERLSALIKSTAPEPSSEVHWHGVERGVLSIKRSGVVQQQMLVPDMLKKQLISKGVISVPAVEEPPAPES